MALQPPSSQPGRRRFTWYSPYPVGTGCFVWFMVMLFALILLGLLWAPDWP